MYIFQESGKRYIKGAIYTDDSKCPSVDYKCTKIKNERNLQWVELVANNAFQGNLLQSTEDMIITPVSIHFQSAQ